MGQITDDVRKKLEAEHGDLFVAETPFGDFAFRACSEEEYDDFNIAHDEVRTRVHAYKLLATRCVVWPGAAELEAAFKRKPGLIHKAANEVLRFSGTADAAFKKK